MASPLTKPTKIKTVIILSLIALSSILQWNGARAASDNTGQGLTDAVLVVQPVERVVVSVTNSTRGRCVTPGLLEGLLGTVGGLLGGLLGSNCNGNCGSLIVIVAYLYNKYDCTSILDLHTKLSLLSDADINLCLKEILNLDIPLKVVLDVNVKNSAPQDEGALLTKKKSKCYWSEIVIFINLNINNSCLLDCLRNAPIPITIKTCTPDKIDDINLHVCRPCFCTGNGLLGLGIL